MTKPRAASAPYPLDPTLDFLQGLWQLNHALEKVSSSMDRRFGVTSQQRLLLRCVGKYPGMTAGQLAGLLHVDPATVSASLSRLERKGLLERRRDPRDRRRAALGLTAKGRALDQPVAGSAEGAVERLLATTPASELSSAVDVFRRLVTLLDEQRTVAGVDGAGRVP